MRDRKDHLTRRDFLRTGIAAGALLPAAGLVLRSPAAWAEGEKAVNEIPAMAPTAQALQYTGQSAKPDQSCGNCQFFTATADGHGKCQLFTQGIVAEGGWCLSWAKKQEQS